MAKKESPLGLQETKGSFQLCGKVTGTEKDNFYKELTTKTGKPMRMVSFGVAVNKGKTVYTRLNGMEREAVYYSKTEKQGDKKKTDVQKVAWADRFRYGQEHPDYNLIGVHLGLEKTIDEKGNTVNDKRVMVEYDACKEIADKLEDDAPVFIQGNIEYSTYEGKHRTNFVPGQISLCKPIDFDNDKFEELAVFTQTIVFMGIEKRDKEQDFLVTGKVITYNSIEDVEFTVIRPELAKKLKPLKPYTAIKVFGDIVVEGNATEVEEDNDDWGINRMERVNSPITWKLVITGADPSSIDTELYPKSAVEAAMTKLAADNAAKSDFGSTDNDDWGTPKTANGTADEDDDDIADNW